MPTQIYPIAERYAKSWGYWEMAREIIQNGLDEADRGYNVSVSYSHGMMHVFNRGCSLNPEALIIGSTDKEGDSRMRGIHGEGLKLAFLVAVRERRPMRVLFPGGCWTPQLKTAPGTNVKVLAINKATMPSEPAGVQVSVALSPMEWKLVSSRFMCLVDKDGQEDERLKMRVDAGNLLNAPGQIYVKGIWVQEVKGIPWGFDFHSASLDRDRNLLPTFDLRWYMGHILGCSMQKDHEFRNPVLDACMTGNTDLLEGCAMHNNTCREISLGWATRHGNKVPVASLEDAQAVYRFNREAVTVPPKLIPILKTGGTEILADLKASLGNCIKAVIDESTLMPKLLARWEAAKLAVGYAINTVQPGENAPTYRLVEFFEKDTLGLWDKVPGASFISINVGLLADPDQLLITLVHEAGHHVSCRGDGDPGFEAAVDRLWLVFAKDPSLWQIVERS